MAPAYKLTYFDGRGRAELARILLKYGNIEFEDVRIGFEGPEWGNLKAKLPFGQLPILEHDGKVIGQSIAIGRYVAKKVGLAGANEWEDLEIEAMVDNIRDLQTQFGPAYWEQDPVKRETLLKKVINDEVAKFLPKIDAIIAKNKGYLVNGKLTWVDVYFSTYEEYFENSVKFANDKNYWRKYSNIVELFKKVNEVPQIKKWLAERPETKF